MRGASAQVSLARLPHRGNGIVWIPGTKTGHMNGRWSRPSELPAGRDRAAYSVRENGQVSDVRHVLVLPDRDAAEEVAEELGDRFEVDEEPQLVRDALAGEDDAEDAQWLVVVEDPSGRLDASALDSLAAEHEGWLETP